MEANEVANLNDSELEDAVGGVNHMQRQREEEVAVIDTRGRACGTIRGGVLYFWPCKNCARPTHMGSGVHQCDKCDDWFFGITEATYGGTVEQLKAASAAN